MDAANPNALPVRDGCYVAEATFWMVWTKTGAVPRFVHHTRSLAEREAIRLAKKNPGKKFIVLAATEKFFVPEPDASRAHRWEPAPGQGEPA